MCKRRRKTLSILLVIMILAGALLTTACDKRKDEANISVLRQLDNDYVDIQFNTTADAGEREVLLTYEDTQKRTIVMTSDDVKNSVPRQNSDKYINYYYHVNVKIDMPADTDSMDIKFTVSFMGLDGEADDNDTETTISDSQTLTFRRMDPPAADPTPVPDDTFVPGDNGTITVDEVTEISAALSWAPAEHTSLSHEELIYTYSLTNQTTQELAVASITGSQSQSFDSLDAETTYEFKLIVSDGERTIDYQTITFTTLEGPDAEPPVPGASGNITSGSRGHDSFAVSWSEAADNETPSAELSYCVYYSTQDNINTLDEVLSNGTAYGSYTVNMLHKAILQLTEDTDYYVNVVVMDNEGNKAAYSAVHEKTRKNPPLLEPMPSQDAAPAPGTGVTADNATIESVNVSWSKATDAETAQSNLLYLVYYSESDNIDTLQNTLQNGTVYGTYQQDITFQTVLGLNPDTTYYFNVVVKDSMGNRAAYISASATTAPLGEIVLDITPPTPGNSGTIIASNPTPSTIDLSWTKGTDDTSAQANLEYLVYYSSSNNISTVADMESNGTAVGSYTADIGSLTVTELTSGSVYYFNIIIRDEAGNKSAYTTVASNTISPA